MKKIRIIGKDQDIHIANEQFHETPKHLPPRHDLRKNRFIEDDDLEVDVEDDEDLENN